jgi:hypothetical protein
MTDQLTLARQNKGSPYFVSQQSYLRKTALPAPLESLI